MIEDGYLVHGEIDSSLQSWQPESFFLNGLLLAVLATILSFQSTSLAYDLFLGIKPRGEVSAPNMHMLLLADEGSPLSVAAAVFRRDDFDRARFYGDIPKTTTIVRNRAKIARSITAKLFFMLLTAPLVNLTSIFLALERDEDVSFAQAGFGPVGYGFDRNKNLTLRRSEFATKCFQISTMFSFTADEHAQFFFCLDQFVTIGLDAPAEETRLILRALPNGQLQGILEAAGQSTAPLLNSYFDFFTDGEVYRIAQSFTLEDMQDLVKEMALFMEGSGCPTITDVTRMQTTTQQKPTLKREPKVESATRQDGLTVSQTFECSEFLTGNIFLIPVIQAVALGFTFESANLTLVDTDTFRVVNIRDLPINGDEPPWFDGRDLTLLKRRRNIVPLGILFICVGVLLIVRLLAECLTNNDVYDGVDEVVARNMGLPNSYAMIRSDRLVRYDHKYQSGLAAHYGTARPGLPEIREFTAGAVGESPTESVYDTQDAAKYYGESIMNPTHLDD